VTFKSFLLKPGKAPLSGRLLFGIGKGPLIPGCDEMPHEGKEMSY
jgi:hypothetical protein